MEITTTISPEHAFLPYTLEEFKDLRNTMMNITTHIPHDKMSWVWSNYLKITNTKETQPCSCGSAAGHWRRAADGIRQFIISKEYLLNE